MVQHIEVKAEENEEKKTYLRAQGQNEQFLEMVQFLRSFQFFLLGLFGKHYKC